jgi:hypothetical protein
MFKKLIFCAGVVAALYAGEELDVTFENSTGKTVVVGDVKRYYSILSDPSIRSEFEIAANESLNFKINTLREQYFIHSNNSSIPSDCIEFVIINEEDSEKAMQKFSILWEKDSMRIEPKDFSGYKVIKKKSKKNNIFEFVLKNKEFDSEIDF